MTLFEYDPDKSKTNKERHGISLLEAQGLWERTHLIIPAKNVLGESRFAILGHLKGKLYAAIFTLRGETLRIISCHRAEARWRKIYEKRAGQERP